MDKLNIRTFNEVLENAFRDDVDHKEAMIKLLKMELGAAYGMKIQAMEKVIDDLNHGVPYHEDLQVVNNIDSNCEYLGNELDKLGVSMDSVDLLNNACEISEYANNEDTNE